MAYRTGVRKDKWFAEGYQQCLKDLKAKIEEGGLEAAEQWIRDNLWDEED